MSARQQGFSFVQGPIGAADGPTYADGRDALDRYYTPPWYVDLLADAIGLTPGTALEPFAGRALAIAGRLREMGHSVITADIDAGASVELRGDSFARDWTTDLPGGAVELVCSNPPFTLGTGEARRTAAQAVEVFRPHASRCLAMLMRLSFLEPFSDRERLLREDPPHEILVLPRYSFRGNNSTDSLTCAWFVWRPGVVRSSRLCVYTPAEVGGYEARYKITRSASKCVDFDGDRP